MADLISLREVLVSLGFGDVLFFGICLLVFLFGNLDFYTWKRKHRSCSYGKQSCDCLCFVPISHKGNIFVLRTGGLKSRLR